MNETEELWYVEESETLEWEEPFKGVFLFYSDEFEREKWIKLRGLIRCFLEDNELKLKW